MLGGPRAQYHLRQTCVFLNMYPVNGPEVIPHLHRINLMQMTLTDENTKKFLKQLLQNLADWTIRLQNK